MNIDELKKKKMKSGNAEPYAPYMHVPGGRRKYTHKHGLSRRLLRVNSCELSCRAKIDDKKRGEEKLHIN